MALKHFLDIDCVSPESLRMILDRAHALKKAGRRANGNLVPAACRGAVLIMIFERPSTRTRVSFDVAMRQLGGETIVINQAELQLGRGESAADTARVLSRYVDVMMLRTASHDTLMQLSEHATVPVINGLSNLSHPCQIMADIMTYEEHRGPIGDANVAWLGDGNNVANSWIHAAGQLGFSLRLACPDEFLPSASAISAARKAGADIVLTKDAKEAARDADCIVTDTWVSMGDEAPDQRKKILRPYQVNAELLAHADKDAIFMHCLPAYRGNEVTEEVFEGPQSVVFDEAENRLHAQKAILAWCLDS